MTIKHRQKRAQLKTGAKLRFPEGIRILPAMPLHISTPAELMSVTMKFLDDDYVFSSEIGRERGPAEHGLGPDPWKMRNEFLNLRSPHEAFSFFSRYPDFLGFAARKGPSIITWSEVQVWQKLVKFIAIDGFLIYTSGEIYSERPVEPDLTKLVQSLERGDFILNWVCGIPTGITIQEAAPIKILPQYRDRDIPVCTVYTSSTISAILATIYFSSIVGIRFEECASETCSNIFEHNTNHDRRFCSTKCGHTQTTRERRRTARDKSKKRATKSRKGAKRDGE